MPNISSVIKAIQDIMRKDTGVDGDAQRLSQIVWMLFLKIFADKEEEYEMTLDDYKSPIPENCRWQNWAKDDEGMTGDELINFINNELFTTLKELSGNPKADLIAGIFEDTYNYMKSGTLLRQVIDKINEIDFNSSEDRHLFNDIYEQLLQSLQSAGNAGEYYTPRAVTQFIVDVVNPQLGEKVLDPACGTGGFLTCAIEHLKKQVKTSTDGETLSENIFGIEKKPLPHQLCTTNMILHGIDTPINIKRSNTLSKPIANIIPADRVNCIITNPPFGGIEEEGIENNFPAGFRTRETADLFLVYIMKMLQPGGRAGIVLPDGSLFGEGVKTRIKQELLQECNLHTIVRLPNGVFNPYTGIKTNLLFFTKGSPTKEIWYYEHPLPNGIKNYSRSNPITIDEFLPEKKWWNNRVENEYAWKVCIDDIKDSNYNLDIKNPHISEDEKLKTPIELIEEISNNLLNANQLLEKIKKEIA